MWCQLIKGLTYKATCMPTSNDATQMKNWLLFKYSNAFSRGNSFVMSKGRMPTWVWSERLMVPPLVNTGRQAATGGLGSGLASGHIWELISILSNTHSCKQVDFREMARIGLLPQCFCHLRWFVKEIERLWRQWSLSTTPHVNPYQAGEESPAFERGILRLHSRWLLPGLVDFLGNGKNWFPLLPLPSPPAPPHNPHRCD